MSSEKRIGALYIRVSTDKQEELSPDAQIRLGRDYAAQHNIHIPDEYIFRDDGISGKKADRRPGFKSLIATARSKGHPIDCILVWKFSRFARNQEESIVYKSMLARDKVEVISISEPLPDGPFGALNERIIEWMDEYYLTNLSSEVTRGMTENAMRGNYQASPGIGYRSPGPKQVPVKDPDTFPIVEYCDRWFMQDLLSTRQIALRLNSMGYRTKRGNAFDARGVEYILRNPFYAGKIRWNYTERGRKLKPSDEVILADGRHEPAWSWEHHLEIQKRLDELAQINKRDTGKKKRDVSSCHHWLSGILICSSCGKTLAYTGNSKSKCFQCWSYAKGMCKESHSILVTKAEECVIDGLQQLLSSDSLQYTVVHKQSSSSEKEQELLRLLNTLNDRERRAKDAYLNGIDSLEEYKELRMQIQSERNRAQAELDSLSSDSDSSCDDNVLMVQNVQSALTILTDPDASYEKKGTAIRGIVDKIIYDRKNTSFDFHLKLVK
ncbi:MAG: recombinase family protein [Roseburia sp.]|nr:recombinase family protein [Roseburia sp.]